MTETDSKPKMTPGEFQAAMDNAARKALDAGLSVLRQAVATGYAPKVDEAADGRKPETGK